MNTKMNIEKYPITGLSSCIWMHVLTDVCVSVCIQRCERERERHTLQRLEMWRQLMDSQSRQLARSNTLYTMHFTAHQIPPTSSKKLITISWSPSLDTGESSPKGQTRSPDFKDLGKSCIMRWRRIHRMLRVAKMKVMELNFRKLTSF